MMLMLLFFVATLDKILLCFLKKARSRQSHCVSHIARTFISAFHRPCFTALCQKLSKCALERQSPPPPENFQHGARVIRKIIDQKTIDIFLIISLSLPKLSLTHLYSSCLIKRCKDTRTSS